MYNQYNNYPCYNYSNTWYQDMLRMRRMYPYKYFYPGYGSVYMNKLPYQSPYEVYPYKGSAYSNPTANSVSRLRDFGPEPFSIDIEDATENNRNFRTTLWTGDHLQLTLMSLNPGEDIGLEMHPDTDQFVRIEEGSGIVRMGNNEDISDFNAEVKSDDIFIVPAGKWHNLINTGTKPLKLYSIYAPPEHAMGTIHRTKEEAMEEEH